MRVVGREVGWQARLDRFRLRWERRRDWNARLRSHPQPSPALGRCGLGGKAAFRRMAPPFEANEGIYGLTATMKLVGLRLSLHFLRCHYVLKQFSDLALLRTWKLGGFGKQFCQFAIGSNHRRCLWQSHNVIRSHIVEFRQLQRVFRLRDSPGFFPMQNPGMIDPKLTSDLAKSKLGLISQVAQMTRNLNVFTHGDYYTPQW